MPYSIDPATGLERVPVRLAAATIVASLTWTACSTAGPTTQVPIELGQPFRLTVGAMAQSIDAELRVGFDGVTADSRCAKGEQCVWAGDATAQIWLQRGTGPKAVHELHTAPDKAQAVRSHNHELRLVALAPYPVTGKAIARADYFVTLTLSRSAAADSDR